MRDFSCCGKTLPSLHDLLQHYEECHAQQTPQSLRNNSLAAQARETQPPNSKAAIAAQAASSVQQQAQAQHQRHQQLQQGITQGNGLQNGSTTGVSSLSGIHLMRQQQQSRSATPIQTSQDDEMEGMEDMEMDDVEPMDMKDDTPMSQHSTQQTQPSMFGQQQRPTLNLLNTKVMPGLRTSQPPTPSTTGFGFQNNPTVSSVNTPTLTGPVSHQNQGRFSPDVSVPGTPAGEMDEDYSNMPSNMNLGNMMQGSNMNFPWGFGNNDLGVDLCIDEPAKRLYSPNGGGYNNSQKAMQQQFAQFAIGGTNQWNNNSTDLMRQYRQQQMMAMQGMGGDAAALMMEEHKPFRCPVIGCEKAYKNQNGLK